MHFTAVMWNCCDCREMVNYLFSAVLVGTMSFVADTKTSVERSRDTAESRDPADCKLSLPVGCSCVQDRATISVECSGAQMTSVPKNWFGSGNLVVKTLNLERNNISEVGHWTLLKQAVRLGRRHNMPPPHLDFWPFDPEVGVGVACDLGYPVQSFVFLGLLVFELEPMYATSDRQTDGRTDGRQTPMTA